MMDKFPMPVCEGSLPQCWNYIDKKRRQIRVRALTAKLGGFFSNLVFFFCLLFGANGLILRHFSGSYCSFLQGLPFFMKPWTQISRLFPAGNSLSSDLLRLLLLSYFTGIAVFLVLRLLVTLLYHPKKRTLPEGNYPQTVPHLASLTQEAWQQSFKAHISSSTVSILLLIIAAFILFFAYTFYLEDATAAQALLSRFPTSDMGTNAVLYVLFAYLIGHFLCLPMLLVTRPLYYSAFPYALVVEAATAALFAEDTMEEDSVESVSRRRQENAISLREEGLQAEYQKGYPIAKDLYLKAALGGDIPAMEHYARHSLLAHQKEPARYWLNKAAASPNFSPEGKDMLLRLKLGRNHNVGYLEEGKDNSLKATRRRAVIRAAKSLLITVIILGGAAATFFAVFRHFGSDPATLITQMKDLFGSMSENISAMEEDTFVPEEVLPFETPVMTLADVAPNWENACVAYDNTGAPILFCYGKDLGGTLAVPCNFADGELLHRVGIYNGNKWDIRTITDHVTYDPRTRTITVSEEYLKTLAEGEYFLILNDGARYIPLLVTEQTAFNSTQRGLAAAGNEMNWIINDLNQPQDITLPFYNLGDNTIRTLFQLIRPDPFRDPIVLPMDEAYYTIAEDGRSVTILQAFWEPLAIGTYADFRVRLANGDMLDTEPIHIGTVQGDDTGLMEIQGEMTYSLSKGGNYTAQYQFPTTGILDYFMVRTDSGTILVDEMLSSGVSQYIDFDTQTISLPQELLKEHLKAGEGFHIYLAYVSEHNQYIGINNWVEVTR